MYSCEASDFCDNPDVTRTVDWSADRSIHNWIDTLNLACASKEQIGLIGSIYFIGLVISVPVLTRLADLYGRKWICVGSQFLQVPAYIWLFFMSSLYELYACFFLMGLGFGGSISVNAIYI